MKNSRIAVLRELEATCYGICLFLLGNEKSAATAAQSALKHIYGNEAFWSLREKDERESCLKRISTAHALTCRK